MNDNSEAWSALVAAARSGDAIATQAFLLEGVVYRGIKERAWPEHWRVDAASQGVALVLATLASQQPDSDLGLMAQAVLDDVLRGEVPR